MAKKRASEHEKSTSTSAPAEPPTKMADGKMVLRIRTRSQTKQQGEEALKTLGKKPKTAAKKRKLDSKKPKKPPTAFFYFLEDFRKEFQEQNPDIKSMRDIGKACGEKWNTMTYEEKVQYYDIAMEKRAEFDRAMADYTKRMESGQDQESEDGSEQGTDY